MNIFKVVFCRKKELGAARGSNVLDHTQKRYDLISIAYARKGIALCNMDKKNPGVSAIKKALEVNSALDQLKMKEAICEEVRQKTDIDSSLL
ncbi:hypothetical protein [Sporolactobacillus putidus]|uniref:hypothetical protein n=1 Tax=Sporolactobacillus putidus TaxID=492735 RepID=UPI00166BCDE7|nr:hypothetical protein [Sporolactobacillus putidus]